MKKKIKDIKVDENEIKPERRGEGSDYRIKEIRNGWLLTGPQHHLLPIAGEETLFVPNLSMLGEILIMWQRRGLNSARELYYIKMQEK